MKTDIFVYTGSESPRVDLRLFFVGWLREKQSNLATPLVVGFFFLRVSVRGGAERLMR